MAHFELHITCWTEQLPLYGLLNTNDLKELLCYGVALAA